MGRANDQRLDQRAMAYEVTWGGRHRGKTFGDLFREDYDYLEWVARTWDRSSQAWFWADRIVNRARQIHDRLVQHRITRTIDDEATADVGEDLAGPDRWKALIRAKAQAHARRYPTFDLAGFLAVVDQQTDTWLKWASGQRTAALNRAMRAKSPYPYALPSESDRQTGPRLSVAG